MRLDNATFQVANQSDSQERRHVIELAFDSANTVLWYFTSHTDTLTPAGASVIAGVVEELSVTSQKLDPDKAIATIGTISFRLTDVGGAVAALLGSQLAAGRSIRRQRVRVYEGHKDFTSFDDEYTLIQTQIADTDITVDEGSFLVHCADVQRSMRKDIFTLTTTALTATISADETTIPLLDTSGLAVIAHGVSYSDAPSQSVGYIKIDDEIIRWNAKTATDVTATERGALNTLPAVHNVDTTVSADRRTKVEEYVYLEMPALKLEYALLTGVLYGQGGATLPDGWHLGIDPVYVRLADFLVHPDLWDPADDSRGFMTRFEAEKKGDGKKFIEEQLNLLMGAFLCVQNDGALAFRRMANMLAGAAYVAHLDSSNIVEFDGPVYDYSSLHNLIQIDWNFEPAQNKLTRPTAFVDAASIIVHQASEPLKLAFRGLHGSIHSNVILFQRFDALRDRYTGPPYRMTVKALPSMNYLEVGDIVRVRLEDVPDIAANTTYLDRSFEVQQVQVDWVNGDVTLSLFASTQAPGAIAPTAETSVLSDAFYTGTGTALTSVLTITGSNPGHVSANGNLAGATDLASAVYYYNGDLVIDNGVTVTLNNNVQLRIKGNLTINGILDGKGRGLAGAAQVDVSEVNGTYNIISSSERTRAHNDGTAAYIGSPKSGGGYGASGETAVVAQYDGWQVTGQHPAPPALALTYNGTTLTGLPTDLRGSSGSTGNPTVGVFGRFTNTVTTAARGGAGGAGGAGLCTISRGVSFGAAGRVNTSGADGSLGEEINVLGTHDHAGSGAGGAPGAWLALLDGALVSVPALVGTFIADYGSTPISGIPLRSPAVSFSDPLRLNGTHNYPYYIGTGNGSTFPVPSLSGNDGGGCRVHYIPGNAAATADPAPALLAPPGGFSLASGTAELLLNGDGTVVPRIRVDVTPSTDPRVIGYEAQFKESSGTVYQTAPLAIGVTRFWLSPVKDGIAYDVQVRAVGATRLVSIWIPITNYTVIGKTAPPIDVTGFSASQNGNVVVFQWDHNTTDPDYAGAEIRYGIVGIAWDDATPLTRVTRGTQITSAAVPPSTWDFAIKFRDTSGNYSTTETRTSLTVSSTLDVIFQHQQAPDWLGTRTNFVKHWTGVLVPDSTVLASAMTDAELWDTFVASPYATCTYEAPEIDIGFDDTCRIWGSIDSVLGPGATGIADPALEVDFRITADAYDGFEPWTIGDRTGRYFKQRLVLDTADGVAIIRGFLPTVDIPEDTDRGTAVIAVAGTTVTYNKTFHVLSHPQVTPFGSGSTGLAVVVTAETTTSFTCKVFNSAGADVGGTVNWEVTGV